MSSQNPEPASGKLDIEAGIKETGRLVQAALNGPSQSRHPYGLGGLTAYLAQGAGKGMRTRVLLSSAMDGGGGVPPNAPKAAAAVELLHMATLVHDDVIDDADTRRGRTTLHKEFGNKNAILCGDYLLSISMTTLAGMELGAELGIETRGHLAVRFAKALASICQGEYSQHVHNRNVDLPMLSYLRVIAGKTAALFYVSAFMGALLGGESEDAALALGSFGRQLGMAFQIADDCKDYGLGEDGAQKPVGSDLKNGVVTLPLILALRKTPALRKQAQAVMLHEADAAVFLARVRNAKGTEMALGVARRFEKKAARILAGVSAHKREALLAILHSVMPKSA